MKALQFVAAAALLAGVNVATAAEFGTKDEAVAMVKKAVVFIKDQGVDKAYSEISNKSGSFIDRDLYVVVYGLDGKVLAHGANSKLIGKDMLDAQDVDGKPYVNTYAWFLRMQDGWIVEAHAFFDSLAFDDFWRRVAPVGTQS